MTAWTKATLSGSFTIDPDKVLELYSQASGGATPSDTTTAQARIRGPATYAINIAAGTDIFYRFAYTATVDALVGATSDLDTLAEIGARLVDAESEISTRVGTNRSVATAGLATGGGDLTADRTITVTASSQAQAQAGLDDTTAMTPLKTFQAIAAYNAALPTSDPHVIGALWVNSGVLTVSAG